MHITKVGIAKAIQYASVGIVLLGGLAAALGMVWVFSQLPVEDGVIGGGLIALALAAKGLDLTLTWAERTLAEDKRRKAQEHPNEPL